MTRAAVLGSPIAHSLSPVLHRAAYAALELDWSYEAIDCGVEQLAGVLAARVDWAGFSATMPLKHALLDIAAEIRPTAAAVGSGNTLLPHPDGGWIADNTDVHGVAAALVEHGVAPETITVLGAGGTAQAVVAAVAASLGATSCTVLVRDASRTTALLGTAERLGVSITIEGLDSPALAADLVVSTLPPGAADALAGHAWQPRQTVLDVVYADWPTHLATAAREAGAATISGALVLLHQAAAQVQLMTGRAGPVPAMRAALSAAAPGCGV